MRQKLNSTLSLDSGFGWLVSVKQRSPGDVSCGAPPLCICGEIQCYLTHICILRNIV